MAGWSLRGRRCRRRLLRRERLERGLPAWAESGDPERPEQLLARVSREVEERVDLGHRHQLRAGRELDDLVTGLHVAFFQHAEVEAGPAVGDEQRGNARVVQPDPDAVAGDTGLRDLEDGGADPIAVADADARRRSVPGS